MLDDQALKEGCERELRCEDCQWGEWSEWSECGCEICGADRKAQKVKHRKILKQVQCRAMSISLSVSSSRRSHVAGLTSP